VQLARNELQRIGKVKTVALFKALNSNELRTTTISFSQDGWFMNRGLKTRPVECKVAVLPTWPSWSQRLQTSSFVCRIAFEGRDVTFTAERRIVDIYTTDGPTDRPTATSYCSAVQYKHADVQHFTPEVRPHLSLTHRLTANPANPPVATLNQLHLRLTTRTCLSKSLLPLSSNSPDVTTLQQLSVDIARFSFSLLRAGWLSRHSN